VSQFITTIVLISINLGIWITQIVTDSAKQSKNFGAKSNAYDLMKPYRVKRFMQLKNEVRFYMNRLMRGKFYNFYSQII